MKSKSENGYKPMTEKQRSYIERLLVNRSIEEDHKRYVKNALQNGLTSLQASGIIDFLKNLIEFKNFMATDIGNENVGTFRKGNFESEHAKDIDKETSKVMIDHLK